MKERRRFRTRRSGAAARTVRWRLPGTYQVRLTVLGKSYTAPLEIKPDPRLKMSARRISPSNSICCSRFGTRSRRPTTPSSRFADVRDQINAVNKRLKNDPREKPIADAGKALDKKMTVVEEALIQTKAKSGQDVLNFPVRLNNRSGRAEWRGGQRRYGADASSPMKCSTCSPKQVDEQLAKWKAIVSTDVAAYNNLVKQQDVPAIMLTQPERSPKTGH